MRTLLFAFLCISALTVGCSKKSGVKGSGDPWADLRKIWLTMKDYYRKTGKVPPPSEIPDGLAEVYNYGLYLPGFSETHSTYPIAYESKPTNGKRYVLFADGRIEQLTDKEIREAGFDPDPLTINERTAKREEKEKKEIDEFVKRSQEKFVEDEKEREKKAKQEREKTDKEVETAREEMAKKQKEFEAKQRKEREKTDKEIAKSREEMLRKQKEFEAKQRKEREQQDRAIEKKKTEREKTNPSGRVSTPTDPATGGTATRRTKPGTRHGLRAIVSLKRPYPQSYPGAHTDKISVQYATIELLKQAGVDYDFKKSQGSVGDLARRWITPNIVDQPCATALHRVLGSVGLTYELEDNKVVLKRR